MKELQERQVSERRRRNEGGFDIMDWFRGPSGMIGGFLDFAFKSAIGIAIIGFLLSFPPFQNFLKDILEDRPEWLLGIHNFLDEHTPIHNFLSPEELIDNAERLSPEVIAEHMPETLPEEARNAISQNWRAIMGHARAAGVTNVLDPESLMSPDMIYRIVRDDPTLAATLVRSMRPAAGATQAAGATTEAAATTNALLASVNAILRDPARMNVLLDATHRAGTISVLSEVSPIKFREGALSAFISSPVATIPAGQPNAGQLTPAVLALFSGTPGTVQPQLLLNVVNSPEARTPEGQRAIAALFSSVTSTDDEIAASLGAEQGPRAVQIITMFRNGTTETGVQNVRAVQNLITNLGDDSTEFLGLLANPDPEAIQAFVTAAPARVRAIQTFASEAHMESLPVEVREALQWSSDMTPAGIAAAGTLQRHGVDLIGMRDAFLPVETHENITTRNLDTVALVGYMLDQDNLTRLQGGADGSLRQVENGEIRTSGVGLLGRVLHDMSDNEDLDADSRQALGFIAVQQRTDDGRNLYPNMGAIYTFFQTINAAPENQGEGAVRAHLVINSLLSFLSDKNSDALAELTPEELSGFFSVEANREAFGDLLDRFNANSSTLPESQRQLIRTLATRWRDGDSGLSEVFADRASTQLFLDVIAGRRQLPAGNSNDWFNRTLTDIGWAVAPADMRDNRADVEAMMRSLQAAGVELDTTSVTRGGIQDYSMAIGSPSPTMTALLDRTSSRRPGDM